MEEHMARIHIIWDPDDRIASRPEMEKAAGIRTAILSIHPTLAYAEITQIAQKLTEMLLEQMCHDQ